MITLIVQSLSMKNKKYQISHFQEKHKRPDKSNFQKINQQIKTKNIRNTEKEIFKKKKSNLNNLRIIIKL